MLTIKRKVLEVYSFPGTYCGCVYEIKEIDTQKELINHQLELVLDSPYSSRKTVPNLSCLATFILLGNSKLASEKFYLIPVCDNNEKISKE